MTTRTTLSRTALPVALVAAVLVGAGCEINSPEMPSFDTTFTLPIGVETLTVLEAVEDEDFLVVGEDGTLGFSVDGDADTLALDFALAVDLPTESVAQGLGDFTLPAGDPVAFAFTLGEVWPPAAAVDGVTTLVPAFPFDLTSGGEDSSLMSMTSLPSVQRIEDGPMVSELSVCRSAADPRSVMVKRPPGP